MATRVARKVFLILTIVCVSSSSLAVWAASGCVDRPVWRDMPHSFPTSQRVETRTIAGVPVNVLVPPSYHNSDNSRRYPVLYLLHGGFNWYGVWLSMTDIEAFTASLPDEDQAIVVMSDGGWGAHMDFNPGPSTWETFESHTLVAAIDAMYRTKVAREFRAIAGESGGGFGALAEAARHPDLYAAVGAFEPAITESTSPVVTAVVRFTDVYYRICQDGPNESHMRPPPNPLVSEIWFRNAMPVDLVSNLRATSIYVASGTALPCDASDVADMANIYPTFSIDTRDQTERFVTAAETAGVRYRAELPSCGMHSFRYFMEQLHHFWPQMIDRFGGSAPSSFDFRSADATRSVWGWTFKAAPDRAPEFLDVTDASQVGATFTGSGLEAVTTASYFQPGATISLTGAQEASAIADPLGRISLHVDLGPAHQYQQYTVPARALEALGDYWTTRTVAFAVSS